MTGLPAQPSSADDAKADDAKEAFSEETSRSEDRSRTATTQTSLHPLATFLSKTRLGAGAFPRAHFSVTTNEALSISMRPRSVIIRIPDFPDGLFESSLRATRVVEVPGDNGQAAKQTISFQWAFSSSIQPEEAFHPLFGLVASEIVCPACRASFQPQPHIVSPTALSIQCPHCFCLKQLDITTTHEHKISSHLFDLYRLHPSRCEQIVKRWLTSLDKPLDSPYFPFILERPTLAADNAPEKTLFHVGSPDGASNKKSLSYDDLLHGIINHFALEALQASFAISTSEITTKEIAPTGFIKEHLVVKKMPSKSSFITKSLVTLGLILLSGLSLFLVSQQNSDTTVSRSPPGAMPLSLQASEDNLKSTLQNFLDEQAQQKDGTMASRSYKGANVLVHDLVKEDLKPLMKTRDLPQPRNRQRAATSPSSIDTSPGDTSIEADLLQARLHSKLKQFPEALRHLKSALQKDPSSMEAFPHLVLVHLEMKNYEEALEALDRHLKSKVDQSLRPALESLQTQLRSYLASVKKAPPLSHDEK